MIGEFQDLYPNDLTTEGHVSEAEEADSVVFRTFWRRMSVPGLPESLRVGEVDFHFIAGPVRTQRTTIRQRPGVPFVFDKSMQRYVEIGANELLTVAQLTTDLQRGLEIPQWQATTRAAIGLVVCMLDERIAGDQLGEDMVFLKKGAPVAAADVVSGVRTFMPFDVTAQDQAALANLASSHSHDGQAYTTAAQLYGLGVNEGPTRIGFVLLWTAVDSLVYEGQNQAKELLEALHQVDFDLDWLSLSVGRLAGLRGKLAHGKSEPEELVRLGFYDMEAIARVLIRSAAGLPPAWPAMPTATAFALPTGRQLADQTGAYEEVWHDDDLPKPDPNPPLSGLARYDAAAGGHASWLRVEGTEDRETEKRLRFWGLAAVSAVDIALDETTIEVCDDDRLPKGIDFASNVERILVSEAAAAPADDLGDFRLGYQLCRLMAEQQVLRLGFESEGFGTFLIEMAGAWVAYREWVLLGDLPPDALLRVELDDSDLQNLGATVGIAISGDPDAIADVEQWRANQNTDTELAELIGQTMVELAEALTFSEMLDLLRELAEQTRSIQGE